MQTYNARVNAVNDVMNTRVPRIIQGLTHPDPTQFARVPELIGRLTTALFAVYDAEPTADGTLSDSRLLDMYLDDSTVNAAVVAFAGAVAARGGGAGTGPRAAIAAGVAARDVEELYTAVSNRRIDLWETYVKLAQAIATIVYAFLGVTKVTMYDSRGSTMQHPGVALYFGGALQVRLARHNTPVPPPLTPHARRS